MSDADLARVEAALAERIPTRMVPDLERMTDLLDLLASPQLTYPSVHVTGTNGKTSTSRMVDALLRAFGLRTGRYLSPHLSSVTERIAIDGHSLDAQRFTAVYDDLAPYLDIVDSRHPDRLSYFEVLTAMAYVAFADAPVGAAVVEVGMGGRWDATNLLRRPGTRIITPIALDHRELGDTIAEVAGEKAGIVHEGDEVVVGVQRPEAAEVLVRRAAEVGATIAAEGLHFAVLDRQVAVGGQLLTLDGLGGRYDEVFLPLHGAHQARNAACALAAVERFIGEHRVAADPDAVRGAFLAVDSPGRLEVVRTSPTVLLDGAHNPAGVAALVAALGESFHFDHVVGVVGVLADKDVSAMLEALEGVLDEIVVTTNHSPRAMSADDLGRAAADVFGADRVVVETVLPEAIARAVELADAGVATGAGILVTGSLYTVGEARTLLVGG